MVQRTFHPIEGTWFPFKAELAGELAPDLALARMSLVIEAGQYSILFGNQVADAGTFSLGSSAEVHTLTLVCTRGQNKGRTIPSIYQLVGDRLRVCFGLDGKIPATFAAPAGSQRYLVSYRRKN